MRHLWVFSVPLALLCASLAGSGAGCAQAGLEAPRETTVSAANDDAGASSGSDAGAGDLDALAQIPVNPINWPIFGEQANCSDAGPSVGLSPLRRISRVEYDNMVRDLLGDTTRPATQFVAESPLANGVNFLANTYTFVTSPLIVQQYLQAAETLAQNAASVSDAATGGLSWLLGTVPGTSCANMQQTDACAQAFIDYFANKAFRGQYDSTESGELMNIYTAAKAQFPQAGFVTGLQAVITTVLTSPRFLFVLEFGAPNPTGSVALLAPNELATRLSLFLWRSLPDDTLLQAATNNQLSTPDQIEQEVVGYMLTATNADGSLKAADALHDFARQWMELENTPSVTKDTQFTRWSATVASDMVEETLTTLASEVLTENSGSGATLTELLTSGESYINSDLASFYGVSLSAAPDGGFVKTSVNPLSLPSPVRAGILTNGSVMATQAHTTLTSPTLRGLLVREQVLCDPIPPPPAGGVPLPDGAVVPIGSPPASLPPDETTRQVDELTHMSETTTCFGCHTEMDPIGFGFGNLDATGAYQATDSNGLDAGPDGAAFPPIDASSSINPLGNEPLIPFNGPVDMANKLASDTQVAECYALQEFRYALSRVETNSDVCSAQQIYDSFSASGQMLQNVLIALVRSDSFRYRNVETPGSACQ